MNRKQAAIWAKLDKFELSQIRQEGLARHYEELKAFSVGEGIESSPFGDWAADEDPSFSDGTKYRIAKQTRMLNGFEVPKPVSEPLSVYQEYHYEAAGSISMARCKIWHGDDYDERMLGLGLVSLTPEAAAANCKARHGIDPEWSAEDE